MAPSSPFEDSERLVRDAEKAVEDYRATEPTDAQATKLKKLLQDISQKLADEASNKMLTNDPYTSDLEELSRQVDECLFDWEFRTFTTTPT